MADLISKIDKKTKAILTVNYFGFAQDLGEVKDLCEKRGISIIEDNSHGLLSMKNSRLLGTYGDIGFSSLYKSVPAPNGGILYINNSKLIRKNDTSFKWPSYSTKLDGFFLLFSILAFLENEYHFPFWILKNLYKKVIPSKKNFSRTNFSPGVSISRLTMEALQKVDVYDIISRRRKNYCLWLEKIHGIKGLTSIFKRLPDGVCPWVFPIIIENKDLLVKMQRQGIATDPWPTLPHEVCGRKDYTNFLAEHLFTLPVHQYISPEFIRHIKL
jgi:dTDP-4-amino-4,6-dideoxygalactose transaminase